MGAFSSLMVASVVLLAQVNSPSPVQPPVQSHFRYELEGVDVSRTWPDGTPVPEGEMLVQVAGIPDDARLYCNATDLGQGRMAWLLQPGETARCLLQIVQSDGCVSEVSRDLSKSGCVHVFKMKRVFRRDLVLIRVDCDRQDRPISDLDRIHFVSDLMKEPLYIAIGPISSGQWEDLNIRIPFDSSVKLDLWQRGLLGVTDNLGTVTVRKEDSAREGEFNLDPHRTGAHYRIKWRIEPDDTMRDDLRKTFRDGDNAANYLKSLKNRADTADQQAATNRDEADKAIRQVNESTTAIAVARDFIDAKQHGEEEDRAYTSACTDRDNKRQDLETKWSEAKLAPFAVTAQVERYTGFTTFKSKIDSGKSLGEILPGLDIPVKPPDIDINITPDDIVNAIHN